MSVHGQQLSLQNRSGELPEVIESRGVGGDFGSHAEADVRDGAVLPGLHDAGGAGQSEHSWNGSGVLLSGQLFRSDGGGE